MRLGQLFAQCVLTTGLLAGAANAQLLNPGFEADNASAGDVPGATGWSGFNSRFTTANQAHSGTDLLLRERQRQHTTADRVNVGVARLVPR